MENIRTEGGSQEMERQAWREYEAFMGTFRSFETVESTQRITKMWFELLAKRHDDPIMASLLEASCRYPISPLEMALVCATRISDALERTQEGYKEHLARCQAPRLVTSKRSAF